MSSHERASHVGHVLAVAGIMAGAAATLAWMGQAPISKSGHVKLWHGVVASAENSQHISDWYTFSHVIHGFAFYAVLWLFGRRWPIGLRLTLAVLLEASWEVFENTDFVINRYREATISLDYYGDSVVNSVSDMLAMVLGFGLASRLPFRAVIALILLLEIGVGWFIRDNLTLNIVMLLYPLESVRRWQMGM